MIDTLRSDTPLPSALAVAAPGLCAVHCLAAPALLVVAPALAESAALELALVGGSLAFAVWAALGGVRRHGERRVWIPLLIGVLLLLASRTGAAAGEGEEILTALGSLALLAGVLWDLRLRRRCACSGCGCAAAGPQGPERS